MAVRSLQGAKREQKSQIKCVQVNPFHEVDTIPPSTQQSLRFSSGLEEQPQAAWSMDFA